MWPLLSVHLLLAAVLAAPVDDVSRRVIESIDPGPLISNQKVVQSYLDCLYDKGPCNPLANQLKRDVGGILESNCASCSDTQKLLIKQVLNSFIPRYPEEWSAFLKFYDPEGIYWPRLKETVGVNA